MILSRTNLVTNILFFTFLANGILGYSYTNILIGPLPLNELLLIFSLIIMNKNILRVIIYFPIITPLLIWSLAYMFLSVPFGLMKYGIWAGRDATHLIEVWWIVVSLYVFSKNDIKIVLSKALKIISILFIIKIFMIVFSDLLGGIVVIQGAQGEIDLLGSKTGINLILFLLLFSWFIGLNKSLVNILFSFLLISFLQSRTIYIGIISSLFLYVSINKFKVVQTLKILIAMLFIILILYLISFMSFLDEYTRFGIDSIAPHKILLHILSSSGESEEFSSAAHGTTQRLAWFLINWQRAMEDDMILWFGQGFGPVLTDFSTLNIVREPHNSYLSVFARTGILGVTLWLIFHIYINTSVFLLLLKYHNSIKKNMYLQYLFVVFFTMHTMYWFSLVEPGFESPQTAINFYILLGLMTYLLKRLKNVKKN